jgi:DNA-binding CsgD family transcriptional regulator
MMSIWYRFLYLIGLRPDPGLRKYNFEISESLQDSLIPVSQHEGRPLHEILPELVAAGLKEYREEETLVQLWRTLTPPERDAVALACLGYTNKQIATRLHKSPATIQSQLINSFRKLDINNRVELRRMFISWDFSAWGPPADDPFL